MDMIAHSGNVEAQLTTTSENLVHDRAAWKRGSVVNNHKPKYCQEFATP